MGRKCFRASVKKTNQLGVILSIFFLLFIGIRFSYAQTNCTVHITATAGSESGELCGNSITLYPYPSTGVVQPHLHKWYKDGVLLTTGFSLTVTEAGDYQLRINLGGGGCFGESSSNTIPIVNNTPVASIVPSGMTIICRPEVSYVTLTATKPNNNYLFKWYKDGSPVTGDYTNSNTYNAPSGGAYYAMVRIGQNGTCPVVNSILCL